MIGWQWRVLSLLVALNGFVAHSKVADGAMTQVQELVDQAQQAEDVNKNDMRAAVAVKKEMEKIRPFWRGQMAALIAELDAVCNLDDEQKLKLEVASKGAVEKMATAVEKKYLEYVNEGMFGGFGFVQELMDEDIDALEEDEANTSEDGAEANAEVEAKVEFEEMELLPMEYVAEMMENMGEMSPYTSPAEQTIWKKTLKQTLSFEQIVLVKKAEEERKQQMKDANIKVLLAEANLKLRMTREQNEKMQAAIDKEYGKYLAVALDRDQLNGMFENAKWSEDYRDAIKATLSESQVEIWKFEFQKKLDSAKYTFEANQPRGGIFGLFGG